MKQRLIAIIAALAMTFTCLTACGDSSGTTDSSKTESSSAKAETTNSAADSSSESKTETTTTTIAETTTTTTTTQTTTTTAPSNQNRVVLDVKNKQATPELPTGKEITAAAIVLNYHGLNVDKTELVKYLEIEDVNSRDEYNQRYDPNFYFLGDPKTATGLGCYNCAILTAIHDYFKDNKITNFGIKPLNEDPEEDFSVLYNEIDNGNPVLIWVTKNMEDAVLDNNLKWYYPKEDITTYWVKNENCVVLIGYDKDKDTVIVSDPLDPKGTVEYPRAQVEKAYNSIGKQAGFGTRQALVIIKK